MADDGKAGLVGSALEMVGNSRWTRGLREEIARVAPYSSNVLITGPSGSGKELVARAIHAQSPRSEGLFIPVDCASVAGELMASQLFGHREGAFTGANHTALGCFRAADKGTIFLDEIGELELPLQAKLLRVLQERVVVPVGCHEGVPVDARVVAATNRDLKREVAAGRFREDLYFRLHVVGIQMVGLAARREDIALLAVRFLERMAAQGLPHKTLSPGALEALEYFAWPGNIRQLKNVLEQAVIASEDELITLSLVQRLLSEASMPDGPAGPSSADESPQASAPAGVAAGSSAEFSDENWITLSSLERGHIVYTLEHTYYNQSAAARLLGVTRQALLRKIRKYEISIPSLKGKCSGQNSQ